MQVGKQKKDYIAAIPCYNCDLKRIQTPNLMIDSQWLGVKDAPKQQSLFFESSFENQKINFRALIRNRSRFAENSNGNKVTLETKDRLVFSKKKFNDPFFDFSN